MTRVSHKAGNGPLYAGLEAGGTKCVCAVGTGPDDIRALGQCTTTTPSETITHIMAFFEAYRSELLALGIASFGPLDPRPHSASFGFITSTPKPGWANTDLAGTLSRALGLPVAFDTDVNAAVLAEQRWGVAQGLDTCLYVTVGTGIGGGAMVNGRVLHGLLHPEMGHMRIPHDWQVDAFPLAYVPIMEIVWKGSPLGQPWQRAGGRRLTPFPCDHPAWALEVQYLSLGLVACICTLAPQRIIMGGGVMHQAHLFPRLRHEVQRLLSGYIQVPELHDQLENYIVPPRLGDQAGVLGALALAHTVR